MWFGLPASGAGDDVAQVVESLRTGRSFKLRIQAATVLARLRDRRVVSELGRAAVNDRHPAVRAYCLRLLARAPGGEADEGGARTAIKRALTDKRSDVRREAERALAALDQRSARRPTALPESRPGELVIAVRGIGDRTGRATAAMKAAMRSALLAALRTDRRLRISDGGPAALGTGVSYVIDGSIARLTSKNAGSDVEATCAVELVVSRPPRGIVLTATGEATVIEPRANLRGDRRAGMDAAAIEHAVKGAHENLARFFTSLLR